jgi:hypothetical protein
MTPFHNAVVYVRAADAAFTLFELGADPSGMFTTMIANHRIDLLKFMYARGYRPTRDEVDRAINCSWSYYSKEAMELIINSGHDILTGIHGRLAMSKSIATAHKPGLQALIEHGYKFVANDIACAAHVNSVSLEVMQLALDNLDGPPPIITTPYTDSDRLCNEYAAKYNQ